MKNHRQRRLPNVILMTRAAQLAEGGEGEAREPLFTTTCVDTSKSEWRKSEERKAKQADREIEKSEDSGSHDDDSLKENREASAPQTLNNKVQQTHNTLSTKANKNKKNKRK
ncbi:hypothetical protein E2C01_026151 [Portunus trituberculatus]|uniref:Uncharacterized protein n=1 Tax=Portunus trituberculatus TaxID=210409 RepID=A0A5B7EEQ1_PORTR|nr:hypothetical protein [Portunus trituberculatus]